MVLNNFKAKLLVLNYAPLLIRSLTILFIVNSSHAQDIDQKMYELSNEELLNVKVTLASGREEDIFEAPASMVVISSNDIIQRGYTSLEEILADLPGMDYINTGGSAENRFYQRGYRTPKNQRTLLMIDGVVDNMLWFQTAEIAENYPITNIEKIEILYGPASAIYGANAFLGIINIVTKDAGKLESNHQFTTNFQAGSFATQSIDASYNGKFSDLSFSFSARLHKSDNPDFSSENWGFLSNEYFSDAKIWGPIINLNSHNEKFGSYKNPSSHDGILANMNYKGFKVGLIYWNKDEGYGNFFAADRGQALASWKKQSMQIYGQYNWDFSDKLKTKTLLVFNKSRIYGDWAEAIPDWDQTIIANDTSYSNGDTTIIENFRNYSYISYSYWNSINRSWQIEQTVDYDLKENVLLKAGINFQRKDLTKAYDIPGYWDAYSSIEFSDPDGPYGWGSAIGHSSNTLYTIPPKPKTQMPAENRFIMDEYGGFIQGIFNIDKFRITTGVRYDNNSIYGYVINPRVTGAYRISGDAVFKFNYGKAFQAPAPVQLYGGWNGRYENPNLKPEEVENIEAITMCKFNNLLFDLAAFSANYKNVIQEGEGTPTTNYGTRKVLGIEFKTKYFLSNPIPGSSDISGYFNYSFTESTSSQTYDHTSSLWIDKRSKTGDISPHKINLGINVPVAKRVNINLRANYSGKRMLYSRNPLRADDKMGDDYWLINGNVNITIHKYVYIALKGSNLLDKDYLQPGLERADSGDDFGRDANGQLKRSLGFYNSLVPGPGRSFMLSIIIKN